MSSWDDEDDQQTLKAATSFIISKEKQQTPCDNLTILNDVEEERELSPDNKIDSSWLSDKKSTTSRKNQQKQANENYSGAAQNFKKKQYENNYGRKTTYDRVQPSKANEEQKQGERRYERNNGENTNYQRRPPYEKNYDRGDRGGRRGNYRGYYNREGNDERRPYTGYAGNQDNFRREDRPYRGRGYNQDRGYNQNRGYGRNQESNDWKTNNYDQDKNKSNYERQGSQIGSNDTPKVQEKKVEKAKEVPQKAKIGPKGRISWPEVSMYAFKCRVFITLRDITNHQPSILVIPYLTKKLEYYPGNIVNQSIIDYRKKIQDKGYQFQPGDVYLQKCTDIGNYVILAFMKLDDKPQDSLKLGIKKLLQLIGKIPKELFKGLVFSLIQELKFYPEIISAFLDGLQKPVPLEFIALSTKESEVFLQSSTQFLKCIENRLAQNMIAIN